MHIVFDWDDTLHDLSSSLAEAVSLRVGYEVLPEAIYDRHWPTYYGVDAEEVLSSIDEEVDRVPLRPGMAGLLRELLFCGYKVTIVTARGTEFRRQKVIDELRHQRLNIPVVYSPFSSRAHDAYDLHANILVDDRVQSCYEASRNDIQAIVYGKTDLTSRLLLYSVGVLSLKYPIWYAATLNELRATLPPLLPPIIGLAGKARVGKDTAAMFIKQMGFGYQGMGFSNALKELSILLLKPLYRTAFNEALAANHPEESKLLKALYQNVTEKDLFQKTEPGRKVLQFLGKEVARDCIRETIWVDLAIRRAAGFDETVKLSTKFSDALKGMRITLSDVRFADELKAVSKVIFIQRPDAGLQGENARHSSEQLDWEMVRKLRPESAKICNDGTLEKLKNNVELSLKIWGSIGR